MTWVLTHVGQKLNKDENVKLVLKISVKKNNAILFKYLFVMTDILNSK
jgi:hypothetical protein